MPAKNRIQGIVIRQQPLGEADVIIGLVSAEEGLLDVLARGARKSSKRLAGGVSLFTEISAITEQARGKLANVKESSLLAQFLPETPSYGQLALASYAAELATHAAQPSHADPALYDWLRASLQLVGTVDEHALRTPRLALEVGFLQALGAFPDVQSCVQCGQSTAQGAQWLDADVGVLCQLCAQPRAELLPPELMRALVLWSLAPAEPPLEPLPPSAGLRVAEQRIAALIQHAVPVPLRSARALADVTRFEM